MWEAMILVKPKMVAMEMERTPSLLPLENETRPVGRQDVLSILALDSIDG